MKKANNIRLHIFRSRIFQIYLEGITNYRRALANTLHLMCMLGSIVVLGSIFWFACELYFSGYGGHAVPAEVLADTTRAATLPEGIAENESQALDTRNFYAALNDTMYSSLNNHETSREVAFAQPEASIADRSSPEFLAAKAQCNLRTSASSIDTLNGVALNSKECL